MEELKAGEYARTNGRIYKVLDMDNVFLYVDKEVRYSEEYNASIDYINRDEYEIEKHSQNIIDLIEEGDYVNGYKVLEIDDIRNSNKKAFTIFERNGHCYVRLWKNEDIETILTKEMYTANCYEVK